MAFYEPKALVLVIAFTLFLRARLERKIGFEEGSCRALLAKAANSSKLNSPLLSVSYWAISAVSALSSEESALKEVESALEAKPALDDEDEDEDPSWSVDVSV